MTPSGVDTMVGTPGDQLTPAPAGYAFLLFVNAVCMAAVLFGVGGVIGGALHPGATVLLVALVAVWIHCFRLTRCGVSASYAYVYVRQGRIRAVHFKDVAGFTLRAEPGRAAALWIDLTDGSRLPTPATLDASPGLGRNPMSEPQMTAMIDELERRRTLPYRT